MLSKLRHRSIAARVSLIGLLCIVIVLSALPLSVVNASKKTLLRLEIEALSTQT